MSLSALTTRRDPHHPNSTVIPEYIPMHARTIIDITDPRMRKVSEVVTLFDDSLSALANEMISVMAAARGLGLAAVQLGELKRIIVTCATEDGENGEPSVLVNPRIIKSSVETRETNEGCLSIPGVRLAFNRPSTITVEYQDLEGNVKTLTATGMLATCIQHEVDHLDGKLIVDHVSKLKRDRAISAFKKFRRLR